MFFYFDCLKLPSFYRFHFLNSFSTGSSSSSSRDSSGDEESESTRQTNPNRLVSKEEVLDAKNEEIHVAAPPKIMSEEELNDLAAKVLRAEIMGDEVSIIFGSSYFFLVLGLVL